MRMIDFVYDGERASDHCLIVGSFDGAGEEVEIGNKITINKVRAQDSDKYYSVGYSYDDVLTLEIGLIKDYCRDGKSSFSDIEINSIVKWLNRGSFYKFKPIYDDESFFMDVYCEASFNVNLVKIGNDVVGFKLSLVTNSPYCYCEPVVYNMELSGGDSTEIYMNNKYYDSFDKIGYIYCDAEIEVLDDGDLIISNKYDDNDVFIANCKANEVIHLNGLQKIIESSEHNKLHNDFNYNYIRIVNGYRETLNEFSSSLPCKIKITYTPVRKVGLIV